ncbi:MAG TPA: hypothetical protein VG869_05805 [Acidimicrobiia bacterium]|jgi:hypothetical protein|nr:hypothetical protein [Acidimicrobiia bacterium]HEV3450703.1 hypothetical protein [Acidimicrobiia bacterium]
MPRRSLEQIVAAAHEVLAEGERVVGHGPCWAASLRRRVPLLLQRRRQFLLLLTDRRLLVFERRRGRAPRPTDLVTSERYEAFRVERVRRARPLLQVVVATRNTETVFEFRPRQRLLGETLVHRVDAGAGAPATRAAGPARADAEDAGLRDPPPPAP